MKILKWLLVLAIAVFLFPFLLRTVGMIMAIIIAVIAITLIIVSGQRSIIRNDADNERINQHRANHDLRTEFAEDETFTEEELRNLRNRNRFK